VQKTLSPLAQQMAMRRIFLSCLFERLSLHGWSMRIKPSIRSIAAVMLALLSVLAFSLGGCAEYYGTATPPPESRYDTYYGPYYYPYYPWYGYYGGAYYSAD
jgi:hypothetical protein